MEGLPTYDNLKKQQKHQQQKPEWTSKQVDRFIIVNSIIGQGQFGVVYRQLIAAKAVAINNLKNSKNSFDLIKREIGILQQVQSPHIVKLIDVARSSHYLYMFFEYCQDGDLKQHMIKKSQQQKGGKLSENEAFLFFKHIIDGFRELNPKNIIHRDIKPANILLHNGVAKISDFGFARHISSELMTIPEYWTRLGSPLYMAPQILNNQKFSSKCDIWSMGVLFYEMLYGQTPYAGDNVVKLYKTIQETPLQFPNTGVKNIFNQVLLLWIAAKQSLYVKLFHKNFQK